jgi:anti-sigma factor RsiW
MCDYSGKLVAWLDRGLDDDQMAEVQRHLGECVECGTQLAKYEQVSKAVDSYCAVVFKANVRARHSRWVPTLSLVSAAAVAAAFAFVLLRPRVEPPVSAGPVVAAAQPAAVPETVVPEKKAAPDKAVHRRRTRTRAAVQKSNWVPAEPAIQVAIPAESMFPPGAVPEGVNFIADVSFGPDGSAPQIRLRPRLIGFEGRTTQP